MLQKRIIMCVKIHMEYNICSIMFERNEEENVCKKWNDG